jgi:ADP-ribose pyrophosphatase YjhB (NUDIX family)
VTLITPIAITILKCDASYVFIKRNKAPYENLFSFVGGKIEPGEHIRKAAIREVREETKATSVEKYEYRGVVSERLVDSAGTLLQHFLIFVGSAVIHDFEEDHREGTMVLFSVDDIRAKKDEFLPSDWQMFMAFELDNSLTRTYEAELVNLKPGYVLEYFRKV